MKKSVFYFVLMLTLANCTKENVDNEVKNSPREVFMEFISKLDRIVSDLPEKDLADLNNNPLLFISNNENIFEELREEEIAVENYLVRGILTQQNIIKMYQEYQRMKNLNKVVLRYSTPCFDNYENDVQAATIAYGLCLTTTWGSGVGALVCTAGYASALILYKQQYERCMRQTY